MKILLVVNPAATRAVPNTVNEVILALEAAHDLTVAITAGPGDSNDFTSKASASSGRHRPDAVLAVGGDGTVNEVINGLMRVDAAQRPAFSIIPAGATNVAAGALGLPARPLAAAEAIKSMSLDRCARRIGLGRINGRYFMFCAGIVFDASVMAELSAARLQGSPSTLG